MAAPAAAPAAAPVRAASVRGYPIISFSHFLPSPELHRGYRMLEHCEGSLALGEQIEALHRAAGAQDGAELDARHRANAVMGARNGASATRSRLPHVHCFGHTHFSIDARLGDGVRYVQHPLGNPNERANGWQIKTSEVNPFACVWSKR